MTKYDTTEQVRAKSVSIAVERKSKNPDAKPIKTRQHTVALGGMATAKEAEKIGIQLAEELGVSEDRIIVDTYKKGEAPIESNPRHRRSGYHSFNKLPSEPTEVKRKPFIRQRHSWSGIELPKSEAEKEAYIAEFEARKVQNG